MRPVLEDVDDIMALLTEMYLEMPDDIVDCNVDYSHARHNLVNCINSSICNIQYSPGVGILMGIITLHPLYPIQECHEIVLYVSPTARGGPAAVRLMKAYEEYAKGWGVKTSYVSESANINSEQTCRFYTRMGYKKCGEVFRKDL